ncbi:MAG: iron-sulfur cluster assembly protein [Bdellovibrionales bacterium]
MSKTDQKVPKTDKIEQIIDALQHVYDPEIPVNIYDLGLIYDIRLDENDLQIDMTLTTANCPLADQIPGMVYDVLKARIPDLNQVEINLVWDPPWDPSRLSEEARFALDML